MDETGVAEAIEAGGGAGDDAPLRPRGIHLHVGSQLGAVDAWREAVRKGLALTALWRGSIPTFDTLDLGGGFPVRPAGEPSPGPGRFARELPALLDAIPSDRRPTRLAVEPRRALVERAGSVMSQPRGSFAHDNHFHVRVACARDDKPDCVESTRAGRRRPR